MTIFVLPVQPVSPSRESFRPPRPVFYSLVDWRAAKPPGVASEAEKRSEIKGAGGVWVSSIASLCPSHTES